MGVTMERLLTQLVDRLRKTYQDRLVSVVLYGSAAVGDHHGSYSDINILCVLTQVTPRELADSPAIFHWWRQKGNPAPLLLSVEEVRNSTDSFPIEFHDIRERHRVLYGENVVAGIEVNKRYYRVQVEHELRTNLLKLRQHYLAAPDNNKGVLGLMTESVSSFASLFRHALLALGEATPERLPHRKREIIGSLSKLLDFDASAFYTVLDLREGKLAPGQVDVPSTFRAYLQGVERVTREVDEKLKHQ